MSHLLSRRAAVALIVASTTVAACAAERPRSPGSVKIRFPQAVSESHLRMVLTRQFAARLAETTGGRLSVQVFPGGELYGAREAVRAAAVGDVELTMEPETHFISFDPAFRALDVPFQFASTEDFHRFIRDRFEPLVAPSLARAGLTLVACWDEGPMILAGRSRLPRRPEDFSGLKIRTSGHDLLVQSFQAMGAATVNIPIHEVYTALQQGVAEAIFTTFNTFVSGKTHEVTPKVVRWPVRSVYVWAANKSFLDGLSADDRATFLRLARETTDEYNRAIWSNYDVLVETVRRAPGGEFAELTVDELAAFNSRLRPLLNQWATEFAAVLPAPVEAR